MECNIQILKVIGSLTVKLLTAMNVSLNIIVFLNSTFLLETFAKLYLNIRMKKECMKLINSVQRNSYVMNKYNE